jgi:hypothetical protein
MKKQLNQTHVLLFIMILVATVYMVGCKKNAASVVGTWSPTKLEQVTKVNGTTVQDTTYTNVAVIDGFLNFSSVTFNSNGQYTEVLYPGAVDSSGNYSYSGSTLSFSSGVATRHGASSLQASVNGNTLSITPSPDTTSTSPLTISQSYITLTN